MHTNGSRSNDGQLVEQRVFGVKRLGVYLLGLAFTGVSMDCKRTVPTDSSDEPGAQETSDGTPGSVEPVEQTADAAEEQELHARMAELDETLRSNPGDAQAYYDRGRTRQKLRKYTDARERLSLLDKALRDFDFAHQVAGGDWLIDPVTKKPISPQQAARLPTDKDGYLLGHEGIRRNSDGQLIQRLPDGHKVRVGGPGFPIALFAAGRTMMRMYMFDEAAEFFRRAERIDPNDLALRAELFRMRGYETGDWPTVIRELEGLIATPAGKESTDVWFLLASSLRNAGRLDQAEHAYRRVLELSPDSDTARGNLGLILVDQGKVEAGVKLLEHAKQVDPNNVYTGINLCNALSAQGRHAEALEVIQGVLEDAPTIPAAWNNFGTALSALGQYEESIRAFQRATILVPNFADAYYNMGTTYQRWGRYDDAIDAFKRGLEITPDSAKILYNLGNAYAMSERFTEAEETYRHVIRQEPRHDRAWNNLGNTLISLERRDEARDAFQTALRINPRHHNATISLATLEFEEGKLAEAREAYDRASKLFPDSSRVFMFRGLTSWQLGEPAAAIDDLTRSLNLNPESDYPRLFLWLLHRQAGHTKRAKSVLSSAEGATDTPPWEAALVQYYAGEMSRKEILAAATDAREKCEAYYYIAEKVLLEQGPKRARRWFVKCADTDATAFPEHLFATWRLENDK